MKRYKDLTQTQQEIAVRDTLKTILKGILDGSMGVKLKHEMHQRAMLRHAEYVRESGDISRFHRFVKKSTVFKEDIDRIARSCAERAYYTEPNEYVVHGIAE
jgi:hypothetical protein